MNPPLYLPLESLGLDQTPTKDGILLRYQGRTVAMLFQYESGLVICQSSGNSETFDSKSGKGQVAALARIRQLRDEVAKRATEVMISGK